MSHAFPLTCSSADGRGALDSDCACGALGGGREPAVVLVVRHKEESEGYSPAKVREGGTPRAEPSAADAGGEARGTAGGTKPCPEPAADDPCSPLGDDAAGPPVFSRGTTKSTNATTTKSVVDQYFSEKDVLRASSITAVLHKRCAILAGSGGSAATYAMSYSVKEINTFISHNWTVDRFHKFYALAFYFNLTLLVYSSALIVVFAVALEVSGFSPRINFEMPSLFSPPVVHDLPFMCRLLSLSALLLVPFGHEILEFCGIRGTPVFLDKTCIDQRTEAAKTTGIRRLGTFVVHSKRFFVIYSDVYFARLWTMYEIATFMLLRPDGQLTLFPTSQGKSLFILFVFFGLARVPYGINYSEAAVGFLEEHRLQALSQPLWLVLNLAVHCVWLVIDRNWAHEQSRMADRIKQFSVDGAECSFESDREAVRNNLLSFVRHVEGVAPPGATDAEAIAAFDAYVRNTLSETLRRHGVMTMVAPYRCLLGVFHGVAFFGVDQLLSGHPGGGFQCVAAITRSFCMWPLYFQISHWFARCFLSLRRTAWKERLYLVSISSALVLSRNVVVAALTGFTHFCHQQYELRGAGRSLGLLMFAAVSLLQAALTVWCFGAPRCCERRPRAAAWGDARRPEEEPVGEFTI